VVSFNYLLGKMFKRKTETKKWTEMYEKKMNGDYFKEKPVVALPKINKKIAQLTIDRLVFFFFLILFFNSYFAVVALVYLNHLLSHLFVNQSILNGNRIGELNLYVVIAIEHVSAIAQFARCVTQ